MYNWSVNIEQLKEHKEQYNIWKLEQMVNFGLEGKKLNREQLIKYWPQLNLDPAKKKYLSFILWPKQF
ncbi:MAG: hypothetical protein ACD_58C00227G0002 [uncultured bacterium]|nr:MAG: hypothetical protein ACD_58C00227G0002 [uncultured bacterium]